MLVQLWRTGAVPAKKLPIARRARVIRGTVVRDLICSTQQAQRRETESTRHDVIDWPCPGGGC
jgi:hypothetical protein